ncbi:MAG TPA: hypothetical protein DGT23_15510 [Micromonosporaceae bacterium]|nr:hypothetical protein [Micromonosporaceae bacterium]
MSADETADEREMRMRIARLHSKAAVAKAHELVSKAVHSLADSLLAEVDLDPREHSKSPDTEAMRVAMRGYRDFLDRVLAL